MAGVIKNPKKLMVHCALVNYQYMDLPVGQLHQFQAVIDIYRRIAGESLVCAQAMYEHKECPPHEPATSAFWWANVSWLMTIGKGIRVNQEEWYEKAIAPHISFSLYLRPDGDLRNLGNPVPLMRGPDYDFISDPFAVSAEEFIILGDILYAKLIIKLTARWGLWHHLKDIRALFQSWKLIKGLKRRHSPVWEAYLESDIIWMRRFFEPFEFSPQTREKVDEWLKEGEHWKNG